MLMVVTLVRMGVSVSVRFLLLKELVMADSGQSGGFVYDGSLVDFLMDGDRLMNCSGLNGLSLDDRLN